MSNTLEQEAAAFIAARVRRGEVKARGNRLIAVRRELNLTERIAAQTTCGLVTNWPGADRCAGRARVAHNQR